MKKAFAAACLAACFGMAAAAEAPPIVYKGELETPAADPPPAVLPAPPPPQEQVPRAQGEECPPGGTPQVARIERGQISALRYCGSINALGVEKVENLLSDSDIALVITSYGGELDAPLRLAEIVTAKGLEVEVVGPCFSGCASFVFVAGSRRMVNADGILGFHNTASSAALLGYRALNADIPSGFGPLMARASREWQLYVSKGVSFDLLYEPQVRIGTICSQPRGVHPVSGERVIDIHSERNFWLPSPGFLGTAGIAFEGSLPATERDAAKRFQRYMPAGVPVPKFTSESRKLAGAAETLLYRVPACPEPPSPPEQRQVPAAETPEEPLRQLRPRGEGPD